jgi:hypothetical protein
LSGSTLSGTKLRDIWNLHRETDSRATHSHSESVTEGASVLRIAVTVTHCTISAYTRAEKYKESERREGNHEDAWLKRRSLPSSPPHSTSFHSSSLLLSSLLLALVTIPTPRSCHHPYSLLLSPSLLIALVIIPTHRSCHHPSSSHPSSSHQLLLRMSSLNNMHALTAAVLMESDRLPLSSADLSPASGVAYPSPVRPVHTVPSRDQIVEWLTNDHQCHVKGDGDSLYGASMRDFLAVFRRKRWLLPRPLEDYGGWWNTPIADALRSSPYAFGYNELDSVHGSVWLTPRETDRVITAPMVARWLTPERISQRVPGSAISWVYHSIEWENRAQDCHFTPQSSDATVHPLLVEALAQHDLSIHNGWIVRESPFPLQCCKPRDIEDEKVAVPILVDDDAKEASPPSGKRQRLSSSLSGPPVFVVEKILEHRVTSGGAYEYLVHWQGYDRPIDNSWEPPSSFLADYLLQSYWGSQGQP